ncbi:MAG: magnesium/cobalt transporter CorA [Polyangiaceae bacterium]
MADSTPPTLRARDSMPGEAPETPAPRSSRSSRPPSSHAERSAQLMRTAVGASPGTLHIPSEERPPIILIDYGPEGVVERTLGHIDEVIPYLHDSERDGVSWIDVRGIGHEPTFRRIGEIFRLHPLALEDVVNVPQRPKSDLYEDHQLLIARMVRLDADGDVETEQLGIVFGKGFVLTVQEEPDHDVLDCVRERIRQGRGTIRMRGADYLAYALLDAVVDAFFPTLETIGERIEDIELDALAARRTVSKSIHDVKRDLLTIRRAIWPQRDLLNSLLRGDSPLIEKDTILYVRDTYDHAVQVMDMVETFRETASGLMDLYLSGVSNRMNEIMKVLTILSTVFLPITFIAGVYGMNFDTEISPFNMPELKSRYGYPLTVLAMILSVGGLLFYYWRKGWLGQDADFGSRKPSKRD